MGMISNIPASTLLIALALGYIVCTLAKKEAQVLKSIGYIIGTSIIVVSSALILAKLFWAVTIYGKMGGMMPQQHWMMQRQMKQPGMMQQVPPATVQKP